MKQDVILVLDCGATNVRAMAVDRQGNIIARAATANASDFAAEKSDWPYPSCCTDSTVFTSVWPNVYGPVRNTRTTSNIIMASGYTTAHLTSQ